MPRFRRNPASVAARPARKPARKNSGLNEAFWRWFGQSRVVDTQGKPLVVYHGTPTPCFDTFNAESIYSGEGASQSGSGFYFTDNPDSASNYAIMKGGSGAVYPVFLSIQKPVEIDFMKGEVSGYQRHFSRKEIFKIMQLAPGIKNSDGPLSNFGDVSYEGYQKVFNEALDLYFSSQSMTSLRNDMFGFNQAAWLRALHLATGLDGAVSRTPNGDTHYVAWFPTQIKSATGNRGTWSRTDPDIRRNPASPRIGWWLTYDDVILEVPYIGDTCGHVEFFLQNTHMFFPDEVPAGKDGQDLDIPKLLNAAHLEGNARLISDRWGGKRGYAVEWNSKSGLKTYRRIMEALKNVGMPTGSDVQMEDWATGKLTTVKSNPPQSEMGININDDHQNFTGQIMSGWSKGMRKTKWNPGRRNPNALASAIKRVYEGEQLWKILDQAIGAGPSDGGCLIFAKAIIMAAKQGQLVRIASNVNQAEHYGAKVDGPIYDADGVYASPVYWLQAFVKREELARERKWSYGVGLVPSREIPDMPKVSEKIAKLIEAALP